MSTLSTAVTVPKTLLTRSRRIISIPQTGGRQAPLQPEQNYIGDDRQNAHRESPRNELPDIRLRYSARDEGTEAARADVGGDRRDRDVESHRVAHAFHYCRQCNLQLPPRQALPRS